MNRISLLSHRFFQAIRHGFSTSIPYMVSWWDAPFWDWNSLASEHLDDYPGIDLAWRYFYL